MDIPMTTIICANCGIPFAISTDSYNRLRECHNTFFCPKGHAQSFNGKTELETAREQLVSERDMRSSLSEYASKLEADLAREKRKRAAAKKSTKPAK